MRGMIQAIVLSGILAAPAAVADELSDASQAMCATIKQCTLEQMGDADGMSEAVKAQVTQSVNAMCAKMQDNFSTAFEAHALYGPAVDCMNSLADLSCAEMQAMQDSGTPECAAYEEKAESYSGSQ